MSSSLAVSDDNESFTINTPTTSTVQKDTKNMVGLLNDDELRLASLGYKQEVKRVFSLYTNFGLAASMISILLGVIPLYSFLLTTGGPAVMFWSWVIVGPFSLIVVLCLAEILCAYPTMGALYFWAYKLGGDTWGPFASWIAGWCNLLGQIAGVSSGAYAGAQVFGEIISLTSNDNQPVSNAGIIGLFALMLFIAAVMNSFTETALTKLCYISVLWQNIGVLVIVISILCLAPNLQSAEFVFLTTNNNTGFDLSYVCLIGSLAAASVFTGYDTAAHVAEETTSSHNSTPRSMIYSVINAFVFGIILIVGMNFAIPSLDAVGATFNGSGDDGGGAANQPYVIIWQSAVGTQGTIFFLIITLVAIECSNCANLTSASRMMYSFARDGALPFSSFLYYMDPKLGSPVRAIFTSVIISFLIGLPGLVNPEALAALFSLTATGLYSSYVIPIILRVTVARNAFIPKEFTLGVYSKPFSYIAIAWCAFMIIILCLPQTTPVTIDTMNYSPLMLGAVLAYALISWIVSARHWFRTSVDLDLMEAAQMRKTTSLSLSDPEFGYVDGDDDGNDDDNDDTRNVNVLD